MYIHPSSKFQIWPFCSLRRRPCPGRYLSIFKLFVSISSRLYVAVSRSCCLMVFFPNRASLDSWPNRGLVALTTAVASMRQTEALASVKFYQMLSIFIFFIRLIILEDFIRLISCNGPCVHLGCSFFLATALLTPPCTLYLMLSQVKKAFWALFWIK